MKKRVSANISPKGSALLRALKTLPYLSLPTALSNQKHPPHFTDEETEAQRLEKLPKVIKIGFELKLWS